MGDFACVMTQAVLASVKGNQEGNLRKITREEKAVYYKHNGFNCCQSVIKAMIDLSDSDKEILTKAASGFAVGMGGMEATLDFAKWFDYGTDAKEQKKSRSSF